MTTQPIYHKISHVLTVSFALSVSLAALYEAYRSRVSEIFIALKRESFKTEFVRPVSLMSYLIRTTTGSGGSFKTSEGVCLGGSVMPGWLAEFQANAFLDFNTSIYWVKPQCRWVIMELSVCLTVYVKRVSKVWIV